MQAVAQNPGNTAVGVAAATVCDVENINGSDAPTVLVVGSIPQVTAVPTLATVTAQLVRSDTGAVIASATATNGAASAQPVGPLTVVGVLPDTARGVKLLVLASAAAGNAVGTVAAPCQLVALGVS